MHVVLKNIQSIKDAYYDLPKTGVVQIKGDNSNGKSIFFKAISAIVNLKILDDDERGSLINDNEESGSITIENDGVTLVAILHRERTQCCLALVRQSGERVTRTFRDGGLEKLIEEFGFRCYNKNSICLQLYETFGPMPFVNTTTAVNGEIVESITEDSTAKAFLKNFKEVTHPAARKTMKAFNEKVAQLERFKEALVLYDYENYEKYAKKMREYYDVLRYCKPIHLHKLNIISIGNCPEVSSVSLKKMNLLPKVKTIDIKPVGIVKFPILKFIDEVKSVNNIVGLIGEMEKIRSGVCPTCGKTLLQE